jgi:hypothetical protein
MVFFCFEICSDFSTMILSARFLSYGTDLESVHLKEPRQMWLVALVRAHFHWQKQPLHGKERKEERKKTQLESG